MKTVFAFFVEMRNTTILLNAPVERKFCWVKLAIAVSRGALMFAALSALLLAAAQRADSQTETVLHNFTKGSDGAYPNWGLIADSSGNLYGTAGGGGLGYGTVFELSPNGIGGWNETVLHSFTGGEDGKDPSGPVMFDSERNLYGTTAGGGARGHGVVFELTPMGKRWEEKVLHSFKGGPDGKFPISGVIMDKAGNLYGTTYNGFKVATVFELSPSGGSGWTKRVIYNVATSGAGLTMDAAGDIFLATYWTVFELLPDGNGGWIPTVLHTFAGYPKDGYWASSSPVLDQAGNLYGTTTAGGPDNGGMVYKLIPGKNGKWMEKVLHFFEGFTRGNSPAGNIVLDASGNIYGTTDWGGKHDLGTVFELVAPNGTGGYQEKLLWSFTGTDGLNPDAGVILDGAGNLYGTASKGGTTYTHDYGYGVVFQVSP